jgi:hypothetical protein
MPSSLTRLLPLAGFAIGYLLVMLFNPIRQSLLDGLRCCLRFKRIWVAFLVLGLAYSLFQFLAFSPPHDAADLDPSQMLGISNWSWPRLADVWTQAPLPALENVAGIFDSAITTTPLAAVAAILMLINWRGLNGTLFQSLRKRYRILGYVFYLILFVSAVAALLKPIVFWRLPALAEFLPAAGVLKASATIDAVAFIFEYLFGVYIQVYLITVCFFWIRGLSFEEGELFRFGVRRFSYVLEWAGLVAIFSTLLLRLPLLLAYFTNIPDVLDYLPIQRVVMCALIISFASVQVSLALHNENLREAISAHFAFLRRDRRRFAWFLLIAAFHFFFLMSCDALARAAIADRLMAFVIWKCFFVCARGFITGWLLASWVCLFRRGETGHTEEQLWIQY